MITIAYFTNDNLLHVRQRINRQLTCASLKITKSMILKIPVKEQLNFVTFFYHLHLLGKTQDIYFTSDLFDYF